MVPAPLITRFAPSPTGRLHLGHAWSAVLAHDLARRAGGAFRLRIEDIDTGRCREPFVCGIIEDLAWLGLAFDGTPLVQSSRRDAHFAALAHLEALGLTYPCFCTRADIAAALSAPHGIAPVYSGTCRGLDRSLADDRALREPHAVRLATDLAISRTGPLVWSDRHTGLVPASPGLLGDIVLARRDIGVGYMLAAVADDAFQGVTDIVRGRDLFEATHIQRLLQALLGLAVPRYHHHPLLLSGDGRRLAKRDGAATLATLREAGRDGRALASQLRGLATTGADMHMQPAI